MLDAPNWTDERVELLTKLWAGGISASVIAQQLGGVSRNAVIGKITRLGLTRDHGNKNQPKANSIVARKAERQKQLRSDQSQLARAQHRRPIVVLEVEPDLPDVTGLIGILDLKPDSCRWVEGDPLTPEHGWCGRTSKEGSSYCPHHHERTHMSHGA